MSKDISHIIKSLLFITEGFFVENLLIEGYSFFSY